MSDEEMVAYLARCQLEPSMPRCSIETLLHAFVPAPHVDHTHPDAINAIAGAADGEALARACFGDAVAWIDYIRPGFTLARQVGEAVRADAGVKLVMLAKHGLVTWGDSAEESYRATIDAINRAADFVNERTNGSAALRRPRATRALLGDQRREELLRELLPALRGAVSSERSKVLHGRHLAARARARWPPSVRAELVTVGAPCPDHLVHTKRRAAVGPLRPRARRRRRAGGAHRRAAPPPTATTTAPTSSASATRRPCPPTRTRASCSSQHVGLVAAGRDDQGRAAVARPVPCARSR